MKNLKLLNGSLMAFALLGLSVSAPHAWAADAAKKPAKPLKEVLLEKKFNAQDADEIVSFARKDKSFTFDKLERKSSSVYCYLFTGNPDLGSQACKEFVATVKRSTTLGELKHISLNAKNLEKIRKILVTDGSRSPEEMYKDDDTGSDKMYDGSSDAK